jgi:hypothetical protein
MIDFSDVLGFAEMHRTCGRITPAVSPQPSGGYLLTLTCACGASLARTVTADEAAQAPFATGGPPPAAASHRPEPPRPTPSPELERAMREALEAEDASAPAPPPPSTRATPRIAPSAELEAVMLQALAAEEASAADPRDRTAPSPELEDILRQAVTASDAELEREKPAPPKRAAAPPPTANVQETVRAALREQQRLRGDLARNAAGERPGSFRIWLGLVVVVLLAGAGGAVYVTNAPEPEAYVAMSSTAAPSTTPEQNLAGTYGNSVRALRRLAALSVRSISLSSYEAQVAGAQAIVGRYMEGDAPADVKRNVRAILDLHLLAVAAWRLRAVDTPQAWEPVSRSPALELCAPVRNAADIAERPGQNDAQARGHAIALAIPLLWECASTRLALLDATL